METKTAFSSNQQLKFEDLASLPVQMLRNDSCLRHKHLLINCGVTQSNVVQINVNSQ